MFTSFSLHSALYHARQKSPQVNVYTLTKNRDQASCAVLTSIQILQGWSLGSQFTISCRKVRISLSLSARFSAWPRHSSFLKFGWALGINSQFLLKITERTVTTIFFCEQFLWAPVHHTHQLRNITRMSTRTLMQVLATRNLQIHRRKHKIPSSALLHLVCLKFDLRIIEPWFLALFSTLFYRIFSLSLCNSV